MQVATYLTETVGARVEVEILRIAAETPHTEAATYYVEDIAAHMRPFGSIATAHEKGEALFCVVAIFVTLTLKT